MRLLFGIGVCLLFSVQAESTLVLDLTIEEMTAEADEILHGMVKSVTAVEREGRIYRVVRVGVVEGYKSLVPAGAVVEVLALGGRLGDRVTYTAGAARYRVGEEILVFLSRDPHGAFYSMALGHSKFRSEVQQGAKVAVREQALLLSQGGQVRSGARSQVSWEILQQRIRAVLAQEEP